MGKRIFQGFYRFRFLLHRYFLFSLTIACLPCLALLLRKVYVVLWAANRLFFFGSETSKHNVFDQFWKFKFHFKHFPRNLRFLSFDGPTNYLYLFKTTDRHLRDQRPTSKITKMWFGPNIKYLSESLFADFCYREGISCFSYFSSRKKIKESHNKTPF